MYSNINMLSVFLLLVVKKVGVFVCIVYFYLIMGKGEFVKNVMKFVLCLFVNVYLMVCFVCSCYVGKWLFGKNVDFIVIFNVIELDKFCFNIEMCK